MLLCVRTQCVPSVAARVVANMYRFVQTLKLKMFASRLSAAHTSSTSTCQHARRRFSVMFERVSEAGNYRRTEASSSRCSGLSLLEAS